jgi:hypothetical protein
MDKNLEDKVSSLRKFGGDLVEFFDYERFVDSVLKLPGKLPSEVSKQDKAEIFTGFINKWVENSPERVLSMVNSSEIFAYKEDVDDLVKKGVEALAKRPLDSFNKEKYGERASKVPPNHLQYFYDLVEKLDPAWVFNRYMHRDQVDKAFELAKKSENKDPSLLYIFHKSNSDRNTLLNHLETHFIKLYHEAFCEIKEKQFLSKKEHNLLKMIASMPEKGKESEHIYDRNSVRFEGAIKLYDVNSKDGVSEEIKEIVISATDIYLKRMGSEFNIRRSNNPVALHMLAKRQISENPYEAIKYFSKHPEHEEELDRAIKRFINWEFNEREDVKLSTIAKPTLEKMAEMILNEDPKKAYRYSTIAGGDVKKYFDVFSDKKNDHFNATLAYEINFRHKLEQPEEVMGPLRLQHLKDELVKDSGYLSDIVVDKNDSNAIPAIDQILKDKNAKVYKFKWELAVKIGDEKSRARVEKDFINHDPNVAFKFFKDNFNRNYQTVPEWKDYSEKAKTPMETSLQKMADSSKLPLEYFSSMLL